MSLRDASKWKLREVAHLNGGRAWFGYDYACFDEPRLTSKVRCDRKLKTCVRTWHVDGVEVADFAVALAQLGASA